MGRQGPLGFERAGRAGRNLSVTAPSPLSRRLQRSGTVAGRGGRQPMQHSRAASQGLRVLADGNSISDPRLLSGVTDWKCPWETRDGSFSPPRCGVWLVHQPPPARPRRPITLDAGPCAVLPTRSLKKNFASEKAARTVSRYTPPKSAVPAAVTRQNHGYSVQVSFPHGEAERPERRRGQEDPTESAHPQLQGGHLQVRILSRVLKRPASHCMQTPAPHE